MCREVCVEGNGWVELAEWREWVEKERECEMKVVSGPSEGKWSSLEGREWRREESVVGAVVVIV